MNRLASVVFITIAFCLWSSRAPAQEEARAAWQVTNFDITANIQQQERLLNAAAVISATNVGRGAGLTFTFRINAKANIKSVTVGGATAAFRSLPESSSGLLRITVTLPNSVAANGTVVVTINYSLPVEGNSGIATISPAGSQFLPLSFWYPAPNSPFTIRGADTAPFRLMVNGSNLISSGSEKTAAAGSSVYEQTLNAQPFFVQGDWDRVDGAGEGKNITAQLPKGATPEERKHAEALIAIAAAARTFYAGLLGPAPEVPIRLVAVRRGSGFSDAGTVLVEPGAFRRAKPDATTALLISEAIARLWIGGQTPVRGEGGGVLRDGLTRFLAVLFFEKQFGREAVAEELLRERLAYSTVARRDAPIALVTPLDASYYSSVPNKGAMAWRLVDHNLGRAAFLGTVKRLLDSGKGTMGGITLTGLRTALVESGGERIKQLLDQQMDQVTDLDLMVGVPQLRGTDWVSALRNIGGIDAVTTVKANTVGGEQPQVNVTVPARNFGEAVFKTSSKIVRVEIDPEKLYPQLDYSNDSAPRTRDPQEALSEANRQFSAQDYVKAESIAREVLAATPQSQEARIALARALLGQNRIDDAEKVFQQALNGPLPTPATLAWANVGLGEINLKRGQAAVAARQFNDAVRADAEYAASLAARAGRIKAETAANSLQVDGAIRTFVGQLDQSITGGKKAELESRVISGELVRFIGGIVGTQPEVWQTRVLRTEQLDANLVAADVSIETKQLGRQESGTAVLILARVPGGWKLAGIDLFEVR